MNATVEDLRPTIVPKSDQLNSEQLLGGPMTITVSKVAIKNSPEQPVTVHYEGENGRPYKPCLTMRKLLVHAWGPNGNLWVGRSMTLYNDPSVKWGGEEVGGIRISHLSDIDKNVKVSLTSTRGKKALYTVAKLESADAEYLVDISQAPTIEDLKDNFGAAWKATRGEQRRAMLKQAYDKRMAELSKPAADTQPEALASLIERIDCATSAEAASLVLDEAQDALGAEDMAKLQQAYDMAWGAK